MMTAGSATAETVTFRVLGIDCDGCAPPIVKALKAIAGVKAATVDTEVKTATIGSKWGMDSIARRFASR